MCTRYISPEAAAVERTWHIGSRQPWRGAHREVFPGYDAPFIRAQRDATASERELVVGQWNLIPWFAKERKLKYSTSNARSEELAAKASYKHPWARGQRCIIPAESFYEPNWETGKHIPWNFRRADGEPWGLAGLWSTWTDPTSGEIVESFTMLTLNADEHSLMNRMHRPDLKRPSNQQDKRAVVPIEIDDLPVWLGGSIEQASSLVKLPDSSTFVAGPTAAEPPLPASSRPHRPA